MTPDEAILYIREITGCRADEIADAQLYLYLNFAYKKMRADIVNIDRQYSTVIRTTNLSSASNRYSLISPTSGNFWQYKIDRVEIQWRPNGKFENIEEMSRDTLENSLQWYEENQWQARGFFVLENDDILIYPKPTETVGGWLKIYATLKPYNLETWMASSDVLIPEEYRDLLCLATIKYVYRHRQQVDLKQEVEWEYKREWWEALTNLRQRSASTVIIPWNTFNIY